jgi:hypothetical protein
VFSLRRDFRRKRRGAAGLAGNRNEQTRLFVSSRSVKKSPPEWRDGLLSRQVNGCNALFVVGGFGSEFEFAIDLI